MFYLTTHSTHFIYGYMASVEIEKKQVRITFAVFPFIKLTPVLSVCRNISGRVTEADLGGTGTAPPPPPPLNFCDL